MEATPPLFQFEHVFLEKKNRSVLENVNLTVASGEFLTILGPSGAGKTTLLRLFNFLETPTRGRVFFGGKALPEWSAPRLRRKVILVLQKPVLFEGTVRQNLIVGLTLAKKSIPKEAQLKELLRKCGLPGEILNEKADHLSGGEQQRLALARALALDPDVLLLDEPTASLDVESERRLIDQIVQENQEGGRTIVSVTHSLSLVRAATRLIFLESGRVVSDRPSASDEEIRTFLKKALDAKNDH